MAYDTKKNNLYATGIEMQALSDLLTDRVGANRVLIVLDACHSGGAQDGSKELMREGVGVEQVRLGKGHLIVSSSTRDQRSWESKRYNNGVFTRKFIESLQLKGRETGLSEDFGYLKESVSDEVQQDRGAAQLPQLNPTRGQVTSCASQHHQLDRPRCHPQLQNCCSQMRTQQIQQKPSPRRPHTKIAPVVKSIEPPQY